MVATRIDNGEDEIDVRIVIQRIEELEELEDRDEFDAGETG